MGEFKPNMINIFIPTFVLRRSSLSASQNNSSSTSSNKPTPISTGLLLGHINHSLPESNIINLSITAILPYKCLPDGANSGPTFPSSYSFNNHIQFSRITSSLNLNFLGELHYLDDDDEDDQDDVGPLSSELKKIVEQIRYECCHGDRNIFIDLDLQLNNHSSTTRDHHSSNDDDFVVKLYSINCFGKKISKLNHVTIVYYDTENFISSQLLHRYNTDHNRVEFVHFLIDSLQSTALIYNKQRLAEKRRVKRRIRNKKVILSQQEQQQLIHRLHSTIDEETINNDQSLFAEQISQQQQQLVRSNLTSSELVSSSSANLIPLMPRHLIKQFILSRSFSPSYSNEPLDNADLIENNNLHNITRPLIDCRIINFFLIQFVLPLFNFIAVLVQDYLITKTMIGTQLKFRWLQLMIGGRFLWHYWSSSSRSSSSSSSSSTPITRSTTSHKQHSNLQSLGLGNVISSVAFDLCLGILTTLLMHLYFSPSNWQKLALSYAETMVDKVDNLLRDLQGMPVGLKLNRPLNMALSQFFLYHIDLWKNFIQIIRPLFHISMDSIFYCGIFGFTCILSLLSDLFSLVTIHIYCFYGYACRLYGHQISGISALWRLFRGKKWNQLRSRVDSYSYDNEQLFIGTILFTILLFLLPTVFMYYLVFLVLRILTLAVQEALFFFIDYLSSMPFYTLALWLFNSKLISGRVYFEMMEPTDQDLDPGPIGLDDLQQNNHHHHPDHPELDGQNQMNGHLANHHNNHNAHNDRHQHFNNNNHFGENLIQINNYNLNRQINKPVIVQLKTDRISLSRIISTRYDDTLLQPLQCYRDSSASGKQLSWTEFLHYILSGQVLQQTLSYGLSLSLFMCYILLLCYYVHRL